MRMKYEILSIWTNFFGILVLMLPLMFFTQADYQSSGIGLRSAAPNATAAAASTGWDAVARLHSDSPVNASADQAVLVNPVIDHSPSQIMNDTVATPTMFTSTKDHLATNSNKKSGRAFRAAGNKNKLAPDFNATTLDGTTVSLSGLKGKNIMLNFWATWCGPCEHEIPYMQSFYDKISGEDFVLLTVNYKESENIVRDYVKDTNLSMPVVLDPYGEISRKYNVCSLPRTYFIDAEGYVQTVKFGGFEALEEIESYFK